MKNLGFNKRIDTIDSWHTYLSYNQITPLPPETGVPPICEHDFKWRSRVIESILLRLQVPPIYLFQVDDALWVIDGHGILDAIMMYINNQYPLSGLVFSWNNLEGCYYKDLEPRLKNRIDDYYLTTHISTNISIDDFFLMRTLLNPVGIHREMCFVECE